MFKWLFQRKGKKKALNTILDCAKHIIDNGELESDKASDGPIPSVKFKDEKGNTLYISWFSYLEPHAVRINDRCVPDKYAYTILRMAKKRIQILRDKYVKETIKSVKS